MRAAVAEQNGKEFEIAVKAADFEALMAEEQRRIYLLCLRMLRNRDEADSAAQDVFIKAYRALTRKRKETIEDPAKWLTRVAVNTCLDRLRSRRWLFWQKRVSCDDTEVSRFVIAIGPDQENSLLAGEITRRLEMALEKLSIRQRSVFLLRHEEDYSLDEIAEILNIDTGTVKAHMARALKKLRQELRDLYERPTLER
jgi:RNA polymerase sigma-70 factor (ECF subfamily)